MIIQHSRLAHALALSACALCFACSAQGHRQKMDDRNAIALLWQARTTKDARALPVVAEVLDDCVKHGYGYSPDTRTTAFELVRDLKATRFIPELRAIAGMRYDAARGVRQTADLTAVQEALSTLTFFRDSNASSLSRSRLYDDAWIQRVALDSLLELRDWSATEQVEGLLKKVDATPDELLPITSALRFLDRSPQVNVELCPHLERLSSAYATCINGQNRNLACDSFSPLLGRLVSRLHCSGD